MYGSHLSIAGSMTNALLRAEALGFDTVQVFTKNQRQWKVSPLDPGQSREWLANLSRLGWQDRTVSHASYLINLASPDDELWHKSIDLMTIEAQRCEALSIPFLVHHPGAFTTSTLDAGLSRIAEAYREVFRRTKGSSTILCLEGTAGGGSNIGGQFEHLAEARARIVAATGEPARIGFCLDTCHMHAAGYDMSSRAAADSALGAFDALCGLANLRVMHINDSKGTVGSKLDRHMHVGEGCIGGLCEQPTAAGLRSTGFAAVVNHPHLRTIPKILETPKEDDAAPGPPATGPGQATPLDVVNLRRLKDLLDESWAGSDAAFAPSTSRARARKPLTKPKLKTVKLVKTKTNARAAPTGPTRRKRSK